MLRLSSLHTVQGSSLNSGEKGLGVTQFHGQLYAVSAQCGDQIPFLQLGKFPFLCLPELEMPEYPGFLLWILPLPCPKGILLDQQYVLCLPLCRAAHYD